MALTRVQKTILGGDPLLPADGAVCAILKSGLATPIYSNSSGTSLIDNPITTGADGLLAFYVEPGVLELQVVHVTGNVTYPNFLAVSDTVVVGPRPPAEFADIANMKTATTTSGISIDWSDYLGRDVTVAVNNTTSNKGGARYTIVNVDPTNLSTLVGGIWVGANHDLGGGYYAVLQRVLDRYDVLQYGSSGVNDSPAWAAAIVHCNSNGDGEVFIPDFNYTLADTIPFYTCALIGATQRGVSVTCNADPVFQLQETWQYSRLENTRFNGDGTNTLFDGNGNGFFGLDINNNRFSHFDIGFDKEQSLFCTYHNTQFRDCGDGILMRDGSGTYHNVNKVDSCYFDLCSRTGISFESASNGSSLSIYNSAFDNCAKGVYHTRPIEMFGSCYLERNEVGIHTNGTQIIHSRIYFLGDSSGPSTKTGILIDSGRLIQLGVASFADSFADTVSANDTLILNYSGSSNNNSTYTGTTVEYNGEDQALLVSHSVSKSPDVNTITNLGTTPASLGLMRYDDSCQHSCKIKTTDGSAASLVFGLRLDNTLGAWRGEAHGGTMPTVSRISSTSWSCSGIGDGRTYTFTVSSSDGQLSVAADAATTGDTIITIHGQDNVGL